MVQKKCELWIRGKGNLRKEDQPFSEWLRADSMRGSRKSVTVIPGSIRAQAPWWRKPGSQAPPSSKQPESTTDGSMGSDYFIKVVSTENMRRDIKGLKLNIEGCLAERVVNKNTSSQHLPRGSNMVSHATLVTPMPLGDCTNKYVPLTPSKSTRKWSKLTRDIIPENLNATIQIVSNRRPGLESEDEQGGKRKGMVICESEGKENFEVVAGFQHHRQQ